MRLHQLEALFFKFAWFVSAVFLIAISFDAYRSAEITTRFRRVAIGVSLVLALVFGIGTMVTGGLFWAIGAAMFVFGFSSLAFTRYQADRLSERERIRSYWRSHVEAGEDVGDDWLYGGKIYHFGDEEREWKQEQLACRWPTELNRIRHALEPLAASPDEQRVYLAKFGSPLGLADLSLRFEDVVKKLQLMVRAALLSHNQAELIKAVGQRREEMNADGESDLWEIDALGRSHEWAEVRRLTRHALEELSHENVRPHLHR